MGIAYTDTAKKVLQGAGITSGFSLMCFEQGANRTSNVRVQKGEERQLQIRCSSTGAGRPVDYGNIFKGNR